MLDIMIRPIVFLAMSTVLGACNQVEQAPPPLHPQGRAGESPIKPVVVATNTVPTAHEPEAPAGAIVPRASVEQVEPGQEALAQAIVAASKPSLAECRGNSGGGTLRVKIVSTKSSAKLSIDSDTKIDEKVRRCVFEALSTVDVPDTLSNASPSMRPSAGFTSIIAVNW